MTPNKSLTIRPVTLENLEDFTALFSARGSPHYCWCTPYRFKNAQEMSKTDKQAAMAGLIRQDIPVGVLAYDGPDAVGWCSVAPRQTYVKLERSRTMPRVGDEPTWTVLCFFVPRSRRKTGLTLTLLQGAVRYARSQGAVSVEGYPYDTSKVSSTHRGHSATFKKAGFRLEGTRWVNGPR